MSPTGILISVALCAAAPAPSALDSLVQQLAKGRCDEAFELLSKVEVPSPPAEASLKAARALAQGANSCRAGDAAMALGFSALALKLAPGDAEVVASHAEGLAAVGEKGEAIRLLDVVIQAQPPKAAPAAWLLRAKLALEQGADEEAYRLLLQITAEPAAVKAATPLFQKFMEEQIKKSKGADVARKPPTSPAPTEDATPTSPATARRQTPGAVVFSFPAAIARHGDQRFMAKLVKGQTYVLKAHGRCERKPRLRPTRCGGTTMAKPIDPHESVFGIDFRVQFGDQPSRGLSAGIGEDEESAIEFVADADLMTIRVFDESSTSVDEAVASCTVGGFTILAK
ncbi:MAG: hypothetical protein QM765_53500 [Myxococcales bacterium]